jgi:hypothetical protein
MFDNYHYSSSNLIVNLRWKRFGLLCVVSLPILIINNNSGPIVFWFVSTLILYIMLSFERDAISAAIRPPAGAIAAGCLPQMLFLTWFNTGFGTNHVVAASTLATKYEDSVTYMYSRLFPYT